MSDFHDRTLALAGVFQSAVLVQQLACEGRVDIAMLKASIRSILVIDALDVGSVFGGEEGVRLGLEVLAHKLARDMSARDLEVARYVMQLVQLQQKLQKNPAMQQSISTGLQDLMKTENEEGVWSEAMFASMADIYRDTISHLSPKIIVQGEQDYLADADTVNRVRSTLLAGIRAAHLWTQSGGRKRHLLLQRKNYQQVAQDIIKFL